MQFGLDISVLVCPRLRLGISLGGCGQPLTSLLSPDFPPNPEPRGLGLPQPTRRLGMADPRPSMCVVPGEGDVIQERLVGYLAELLGKLRCTVLSSGVSMAISVFGDIV